MTAHESPKTVLVTGAGGFVGSAVVGALIERGAVCRALCGSPGDATRPLPASVDTVSGDICDFDLLCELCRGVDVVVHLAGLPSVQASFQHAAEFARVHVQGTATLLQAAERAGVGRFVYVSSAEVYGRPRTNPVSENHPLEARSPYGAAKLSAERFVESFVHAYGIHAVILRPFSIYGPGLTPQSLIGTILEQAKTQEAISLADLRPVRDYCHVADVADAVVRACFASTEGLQQLNIGTGRGVSVHDVARTLLECLHRDLPIRSRTQTERPGAAEIFELCADRRRASEVLGWVPRISLEEGLAGLVSQREAA